MGHYRFLPVISLRISNERGTSPLRLLPPEAFAREGGVCVAFFRNIRGKHVRVLVKTKKYRKDKGSLIFPIFNQQKNIKLLLFCSVLFCSVSIMCLPPRLSSRTRENKTHHKKQCNPIMSQFFATLGLPLIQSA